MAINSTLVNKICSAVTSSDELHVIVEVAETSTGTEQKHVGFITSWSQTFIIMCISAESEQFELIHIRDITTIKIDIIHN